MSTPRQDTIIASSSDGTMEAQDTHLPLLNSSSPVSDGRPGQELGPSDPNLCKVCNVILQNEVELGYVEHPHHTNLFELERAAQDGCHLCRFILTSIKPDQLQTLRVHHDRVQRLVKNPELKARQSLIWYQIIQDRNSSTFTLRFRGKVSNYTPWDPSNRFISYTMTYFSCTLAAVEDSYEVIQHIPPTINDQTWALTGNWLQTCLTSHVKCNRGRDLEAWLPSRLIDIGEPNSTIEPRLCLSVELPQASRYIALSHCWGRLEILRLLEGNLKAFKLSLPWDKLSKTFQDAILITKRFRVRYLWIDSLRIIQDSRTDWEQEAAMMGRVYERCWLNIAASGASDGNGGLLAERDTTAPWVKAIKARFGQFSHLRGTYLFLPHSFKTRFLRDEPLERRAWVYQERHLSPRTLHFTTSQVYWECCERDACEMLPSGIPPPAVERLKGLEDEHGKVDCVAQMTTPDPRLSAYDTWDTIVHAYTLGNLSYNSDKLIALTGVAQKLEPLLHSEYLAGLWRDYLDCQILWYVRMNKETKRPEPYRAPSWSWASVNGNIMHVCKVDLRTERDLICKILNVQVSSAGDPILGKVYDGFLRLKGRLMLCDLRRTGRAEHEKNQDWLEFHMFGMLHSPHFHLDVDSPHLGTDLHFMPVLMDHDSEDGYIRGIVLEPTGQKRGQFRRFRQVDIYRRMQDFHLFKRKSDPGKMSFEEWNGVDEFTISII